MAISTYAELKQALSSWSHRDDVLTSAGDYIALAERRIRREMQIREEEVEASLTATIGSATIALPSDFKSSVALYMMDVSPRESLTQVLPSLIERSTANARPSNWCIDGANVRFDCPADAAYSVSLRYLKTWELSDTNTTNDVLTKWPDVYLAAGLIEVFANAWDNENEAKWMGKFNEAVAGAKFVETSSHRFSPLVCEMSGQSFDIYRGE